MTNERMRPREDERNKRVEGFYRHPETGLPHVSVTTVLDHTLAKPALYYWNQNMALAALRENPDWMKLDEQEARKLIRGYVREYTDNAKSRGSRVHSMVEAYLLGSDVKPTEQDQGYFKALTDWMEARGVQMLGAEQTVFSKPELRYAGTLDLLATFRGEDSPHVVDFKTGSGLYPEYPYQAAAYGVAIEEDEGIPIAGTEVVLLNPDGTFETASCDRETMLANYEIFRAAQAIYEDRNRRKLERMGYFDGGGESK